MKAMLQFTRHVLRMPLPWRLWVGVLFMTNMGAVVFLPNLEAWIVLGGLGLGAILQTAIFARLGFVRLLGLGHVQWFPMLGWLLLRLGSMSDESYLQSWVIAVCVVCGLSLIIDTVEVFRYLRGKREPTIVIKKQTT